MPFDAVFQTLVQAVIAVIAASLAIYFLNRMSFAARARAQTADPAEPRSIFLFQGPDLVDTTPAANHLLSGTEPAETDMLRVLRALGPRFPDIEEGLHNIETDGEVNLRSLDGTSTLAGELIGGRVRLTVTDLADGPESVRVDASIHRSLLRELDTLRSVSMDIAFPVWMMDPAGHVTWANNAYVSLCQKAARGASNEAWPPMPAFEPDDLETLSGEGGLRRLKLSTEAEEESWSACQGERLHGQTLYSAVHVDATVVAETQLRQFMQTLTKTFSHLTTGLAIFDRDRKLVLFNPALTDLTGLTVEFLAARPTLYSLLDRLRDRRMIPEPKDYGSWRREIADLEAAAADGTFSDTWSLPDGRTYRVTGRPHPGGAVAIMMEDISAEMTLTRQFRTELELGQAVIDALDEAIIVFGPNGTLSMANRAYQELWRVHLDEAVSAPPVSEVTRLWMARSLATPIWGDIREFVLHQSDRISWDDHVRLVDGTELYCRITPLGGGSTMVGFQISRRPVRRTERLEASG